jgi:Fe-S-cluster-containing hydrogenase component 2
MQTGPQAKAGFDIVLTEMESEGKVFYIARSGSDRGQTILSLLSGREASAYELEQEQKLLEKAERHMGQQLETKGLKDALVASHDHPHWKEVESRCLSCANCTSVCPTSFCSTVEDTADLTLHHATRVRKWTSCFTREFTYLHGGYVRHSGASRYRHWITHKLSGWHDQFEMSGCVGCGRCITWCPVGINIVEEATAILQSHTSDKRVAEEINK